MASSKLQTLLKFTACDVSDALLKLKVPGAGFLSDLRYFPAEGVTSDRIPSVPRTAAPASTVLFVPKSANPTIHPEYFHGIKESNIPSSAHYVDLTPKDSFMILSQPQGQNCAVLGGIMSMRMKHCGAKGIIVDGRIRDISEQQKINLPIWAKATSTVGAGAEAKPWALDVPIVVSGIGIRPGDIILSDPLEGVVAIPADKLDAVLELMPKLTDADDKVKEDVEKGVTVKEAFARHRSAL